MTIPSHFTYIATSVPPDNASTITKNTSKATGFRWASTYSILTTILAVLLSAIGIVFWLIGGSNMYLIALESIHLGLEIAPLTARTALPLMWAICGICTAFFST
jgi:hypothetical protein